MVEPDPTESEDGDYRDEDLPFGIPSRFQLTERETLLLVSSASVAGILGGVGTQQVGVDGWVGFIIGSGIVIAIVALRKARLV